MFVILVNYKKSLDIVDQYLADHVKFLDHCYENDYFIASGRRNPRTGGVILSHLTDQDDIQKIIQQDPFFQHEIADYEIINFTPSKYHPILSALVHIKN